MHPKCTQKILESDCTLFSLSATGCILESKQIISETSTILCPVLSWAWGNFFFFFCGATLRSMLG